MHSGDGERCFVVWWSFQAINGSWTYANKLSCKIFIRNAHYYRILSWDLKKDTRAYVQWRGSVAIYLLMKNKISEILLTHLCDIDNPCGVRINKEQIPVPKENVKSVDGKRGSWSTDLPPPGGGVTDRKQELPTQRRTPLRQPPPPWVPKARHPPHRVRKFATGVMPVWGEPFHPATC